jgi:nickel transport protein
MKHLTFIILILITLSGTALAHKVNIFAWVAADTIYCETYFPDGRPVIDGKITVFDKQENELISGRTDDKGLYQFKIPKLADLTIVIKASMGHKNSFTLKETDLKP